MLKIQQEFPSRLPTQSKVFKLGRSIALPKGMNDGQGTKGNRRKIA